MRGLLGTRRSHSSAFAEQKFEVIVRVPVCTKDVVLQECTDDAHGKGYCVGAMLNVNRKAAMTLVTVLITSVGDFLGAYQLDRIVRQTEGAENIKRKAQYDVVNLVPLF